LVHLTLEDSQYGSFAVKLDSCYVAIHPEMYPAKTGIAPSGRYFIYCIDPVQGSCHFIIKQDENYEWFSEFLPPFITKDLVGLIAEAIESKK
jgi:hypothetical protein